MFCTSVYSLGQELLFCILDIVDVPEITKETVIAEDDFKKILDWCDLWIILFGTTGKSLPKLSKFAASLACERVVSARQLLLGRGAWT